MNLTIERLAMSGSGKKVLWCIRNENIRMFQTESGSFVSWQYKKHAQSVIDKIKKDGLDSVKDKLDYKWKV